MCAETGEAAHKLVFASKLVLVLFSVASHFIPLKPYAYLVIVPSLAVLLARRRFLVVASIAGNTALLLSILTLLNLLVGGSVVTSLYYALYVAASLTSILMFLLTTPAREVEEYLGLRGFARFVALTEALSREVRQVYETFRARGFEVRLNVVNAVPPLTSILLNVIERVAEIEESHRARGAE